MAELLKLYLRKEPTNDRLLKTPADRKGRFDVCAYVDPEIAEKVPGNCKARWPWFSPRKPRKGQRRVMLNCFFWEAIWMEDLAHGLQTQP